ncbi:MAG: hypothetical protein EX285_04470 [Thaumarchaeota archaeon]|nr:hypothetical protein [Nitrososphaerota archaeon]
MKNSKSVVSLDYVSQIERGKVKASRIEKYDEIHRNGNYYTISHDGWRLPGVEEFYNQCNDCGKKLASSSLRCTAEIRKGVDMLVICGSENITEYCGVFVSYGCLNVEGHSNNQAYVKTYALSCFRSSCEKCWYTWSVREANRGTHKIQTYQKITTTKYRKNPAKHIVISVPKKDWDLDYNKLKKYARNILKTNNIKAGCMIFHPYRLMEKPKDGFIDDIQEWYWSPHFHIIGFGWMDDDIVNDTYHQTQWVISNLGTRDSVYSTFSYQLSHCGIAPVIARGRRKFHSVTWFGDLSNSSIAKYYPECKPLKDENPMVCPKCVTTLRKLVVLDYQTLFHKPPGWSACKFEGYVDYFSIMMRYAPERSDTKIPAHKLSLKYNDEGGLVFCR